MKKAISVFMAILLIFCLTACGAKVDPNDPNQGLWKAKTGEMFGISIDVEDFFGKGFTIELQSKGKCALIVDGDKANGTWTLNNGAFTVKGGGLDCQGRLENGKLTLEDVLGMGLTLIFEKEGGSSGAGNNKPGASDVGYYVIDSIVQGSETYTSDELKAMDINYYVLLNADGTAEISTDILIEGTWKTGQIDYKEDGEDVISKYTLAGDTLTIEIGDGAVKMIFKRSSGTPSTSGNTDNSAAALSETYAWWDGQWYGWCNILEAKGTFSYLEDATGDCYAFFDMSSDGTGELYLWSDYAKMGTIDIEVDPIAGDGIMGELKTLSGTMFDEEVEDGDWFVDPTDEDYEDFFYVMATVRTSNNNYVRYEIYLRPWGMDWEDVPYSMQPYGYDNWYIGDAFIYYDSMLDALEDTKIGSEYVYVHPELPDRAFLANNGGSNTQNNSGNSNGGTGGSSSASGLTTIDIECFTVDYPANSEHELTWLDDNLIKDKDGRYEITFIIQYSTDRIGTVRQEMTAYSKDSEVKNYTEFTQTIDGMTDVFAMKYNSVIWNEARYSIAFPQPIEGCYGMQIQIKARDISYKIDTVLALPEVQAILDSIKFKS